MKSEWVRIREECFNDDLICTSIDWTTTITTSVPVMVYQRTMYMYVVFADKTLDAATELDLYQSNDSQMDG